MYAPAFPGFYKPKPLWHLVHPLVLQHAACNTRTVLNCVLATDEMPAVYELCSNCAARVAKTSVGPGVALLE